MTDRICRHCGEDMAVSPKRDFGLGGVDVHAAGDVDHAPAPIPPAAWGLACCSALYASEAERFALAGIKGGTKRGILTAQLTDALLAFTEARAKADAYQHAIEVASPADTFEAEKWAGYARARLEAVLAESTVDG